MRLLGSGVERFLLLLFSLAQRAFILQGLAAGCAWMAAYSLAPANPPAWLRSAMASALLLSATFFVAGLLLIAVRRWRVPDATVRVEAAWPWPALLAACLLVFGILSGVAGSGLPSLWSLIADRLDAAGFWDEWARGGAGSGLVMLPIMASLVVPVLVTASALFAIAFPLGLLPLLAARSRHFPTLLAMGTVCQLALVAASWLSIDALSRLAHQALAAMATSGDAEVLGVASDLEDAIGTLLRTVTALAAPTVGLLAWLAYLRPTGPAAAYFAETGITVAPAPTASLIATRSLERSPRARSARIGLAVLGVFMLIFSAADALRTRAIYVSSQPAPGASLEAAPSAVRVTFCAELDPASSIRLTRLSDASGSDLARDIDVVRRLASDDPLRRTIEAVPTRLSSGLYRVAWQALPARGGVPRHGSYSFGIGAPVPIDTPGFTHSLTDRDAGTRSRRSTIVGGLLLLVLGGLLPRLSPGGIQRATS
jgi:methionine-rich copper-binding protein CopC